MKYIVNFSGFAYVEADSEEEAMEKYFDGEEVYKEENSPTVEEVDDFFVYM
jgi:hypothetical protein